MIIAEISSDGILNAVCVVGVVVAGGILTQILQVANLKSEVRSNRELQTERHTENQKSIKSITLRLGRVERTMQGCAWRHKRSPEEEDRLDQAEEQEETEL